MEERPCEGALGIYSNHGEESSPDRSYKSVNNDQSHCQLQDEETQTKKTGNGKINGTCVEGEETPTAPDPVNSLHPMSSNSDQHLLETDLKPKFPGKVFTTHSTGERKGNNNYRNSMDCKNDKPSELKILEGKKEALASLNGIVALNSSPLTNGYPSKPSADNDGTGSESGYTTPKKRRAQRSFKGGDNVSLVQMKAMQQATVVSNKQETEPSAPETAEKASGLQLDSGRAPPKAEARTGVPKPREMPASMTSVPPVLSAGELQRKNSDSKAAGGSARKFEDRSGKAKVTVSVTTKEDSWALFKPPPVFPVDNSSAKIVPKISYASKVKENLNKTAQAAGDSLPPPPQVPGRLSQVPMSAVKTITSASFTNGPLPGEGNGCPLPGPLFTIAAGTAPLLVSPIQGGENVAPSPGNGSTTTGSTTTTAAEPRKPSLFVYPLAPSNMQLSLPSGRQADPPAAPTNPRSLGDIFQNQWGLSFINEPSAGPEGAVCRAAAKGKPMEVTFQGGCPAAVAMQASSTSSLRLEHPPFPKAYELDKRTSPQILNRVVSLCTPVVLAQDGCSQTPVLGLDAQKDEAGSLGAIVFCSSSKDLGAELPRASPTAPLLALAREQSHAKGFDRRSSWGLFDLKAAVIYHTKEMEYILSLQKQDPKRVVLYGGTKDGPDQ